ncbi:ATP-dependent helicase HrpB [Martelella alba]|uniref:ATP-dependent helicase HrpB n=1 Tax=Martelella alba TaxID=2590451 RepID=A0A506U229_9HYPH|nr:ATP-dependent helicase HrpB [Martelella alba]TPW28423.1 ATP-dependent helicase HrpB [Martelella alba]
MGSLPDLPVTEILGPLTDALLAGGLAVLAAPPGAGKTTLVPLHLLAEGAAGSGKIILIEPRRLAARAAANRMAALLDEDTGETVGYRMRLDSKISSKTRIEVVTEGVFTRMALDDAELSGITAVIFDEFHERSLDGDFGLALALDIRAGLREDLKVLVMSATLDTRGIAKQLGNAPVIESAGRAFPVSLSYRPRPAGERIEDSMATAITRALAEETGSILAFLPGQAEITRTKERLLNRVGENVTLTPLYGNLSRSEQDAAIRPAPEGTRKVVLATAIAETSITIDGVTIVIDSGLKRLPVFEPATGITRLETVRASRASADQRAGRAGRTAPGTAIRLWHEGQNAALAAFDPPEILSSDLTAFALDLAHWGVTDPASLSFLDQPPAPALTESRRLLMDLGALDGDNRITDAGRDMRALSLPPRLAAMVRHAAEDGMAEDAARLAVMMGEQGLGGNTTDLAARLSRFAGERGPRAEKARNLARRIAASLGRKRSPDDVFDAAIALTHAFPDRIAMRRGGAGRFLLANGRGAELPDDDALASADFLVVADLTGAAAKSRILAAASLTRRALETEMADAIETTEECFFDRQSGSVRARRMTRLGALVLAETPLGKPSGAIAAAALAEGLLQTGLSALPFSKDANHLRERVNFLHRKLGAPWPDFSDAALLADADAWFTPFQSGVTSLGGVSAKSLSDGLAAMLGYERGRELDKLAPTHFTAPTGERHPIHYDGAEPRLSIRVQEMFGLTRHPAIAGDVPLLLELTSPAHRPIQTTRDLPGFWAGSWKDVRADMRGRYPKHVWPEDPASATPTRRAKPRGT